jgi:hypothetical protein
MKDLARYRAMESLCRQSAAFSPLDSWRLLAEAEMWHHKAQDEMVSDPEIISHAIESNVRSPTGALAQSASLFPRDEHRLPAD